MKITSACLAASLSLFAAHAVPAFEFATVHGFATELAPAQTCSQNDARGIAVDNGVKPLRALPATQGIYRFLGASYATGELVGASVTASGCTFKLVTDISKRPWCEYLPNPAARCPTAFSAR